MGSSSKHPLSLDLSKQRLFIHPDAPIPKFHPAPKAVMVTPVYDYDGPIPSPPNSPSKGDNSEALYKYGFNAAHDALHKPNRSRSRRPNKLQRRYSSYSPTRGRSRTRPYHSTPYPSAQPTAYSSSQSNQVPFYPPALSHSGPSSSDRYRSRPSNDPLAINPPDYQIQATGVGGQTPYSHSSYNDAYDSRPSSPEREWAMRARPPDDPIAQNPPDYQIQATGQAGGGAGHVPQQQPYSAPAFAGSHSAAGHAPPGFGSHHGSERPVHCDSFEGDSMYGGSQYGGGGHHGHGGGRFGSGGNHTAGGRTHHGNSNHVTHNGLIHSSHAPSALHSSRFPLPGIIKNKLETRHAKNKRKFDAFVQEYLQKIPLDPEFCLSRCCGGKKAVCIGINYVGQRDELKGCANDARAMRDWLMKEKGFHSHNILLMTDDDRNNKLPTRKAIFEACMWLVQGAQRDDSLFIHYSGHGGQSPDASGRELDGMDETIFPVDYDQEGDIIDDELYLSLVRPLPAGVRLTAVFDSCHSGTILDLPYVHSSHGRLRSMKHISRRAIQRGVAPKADVVCFAACRDDEKAADTFGSGFPVGAMSHALLKTLYDKPTQTYDELIHHLRDLLVPKYGQKAQFSGSHPMDLDERFTL